MTITNIRTTRSSVLAIALASCLFLTSCAPWAVTLMNQIVVGTVGAINLAAAIKGTAPDQSLIAKVQAVGNGFIQAYTDWQAAAPNLKPGAWARVQEAMKLVQQDLPPILQGLGVNNPTYLAVADFVIGEVMTLANTITGTSAKAASSGKMTKSATLLSPSEFKSG
jgi:hypothetical protein